MEMEDERREPKRQKREHPNSITNAGSIPTPTVTVSNDYCQHFVDTGLRPQNYIRDVTAAKVLDYYPHHRKLLQMKNNRIAEKACPATAYMCDLKHAELSEVMFGTKFDVILIDPPWQEYAERAPFLHNITTWTHQEILDLPIQKLGDTQSFVFLWVGTSQGLDRGRECLSKWGYHRIEDICWVKTNKHNNQNLAIVDDPHSLLQRTKEHCLVGAKGFAGPKDKNTYRHIIHCNIDTDVIISEEPKYGSTKKPEELYGIIERFVQGGRRIELFGEDHNKRRGWLTVGDKISDANFNKESYLEHLRERSGNMWKGTEKNQPSMETSHVMDNDEEIEYLRAWCGRLPHELQLEERPNRIHEYRHKLPNEENLKDQFKYLLEAYEWWIQWQHWLKQTGQKDILQGARKLGVQWYEWEQWYQMYMEWFLEEHNSHMINSMNSSDIWSRWTTDWQLNNTLSLPQNKNFQVPQQQTQYFTNLIDWSSHKIN